jgi:type I restriction enzyme M protein
MSIGTLIKTIQDIMRKDVGVDGDAQRISQIVWLLFLKIFDDKEQEWQLTISGYKSPLQVRFRWSNWAKDAEGITGEELIDFVNNELFPSLKKLATAAGVSPSGRVVGSVFEDAYNYMKSGTLLRQVINAIESDVDFNSSSDRHLFNDIYEKILADLQSAGNAGEYYTPRAVTQFMVDILNPQLGESVLDPACGTGGFLTCTIDHLKAQVKTAADRTTLQDSIHGVEKKPLPHMLAMTNLMLHGIDVPSNIRHDNTLSRPLKDYGPKDRIDIILTNPPFGGMEEDGIENNFPRKYQTRETADLFMALIMHLLKHDTGRAAVVLPDGFLFGEGAKTTLKRELLEEFNLHTIVRLPRGVFAPYTSIATNLLFFEKGEPTKDLWFFEHPYPDGYKSYSRSKPLDIKEFDLEKAWWGGPMRKGRKTTENAWKISAADIAARNYNLDCKNPHEFLFTHSTPATLMDDFNGISKNYSVALNAIRGELLPALSGEMRQLLDLTFNTAFTAPGGFKRLRELIRTLALQGKLVAQDSADVPAIQLLKNIQTEKRRHVEEGRIKSPKPTSKINLDEAPYLLPNGWHWVRLIEVGTWGIGSGLPHSIQGDQTQDIFLCKVSDMNLPGNERYITSVNNTISNELAREHRLNILEEGTIIFPKIGGAIATNKRRILTKRTVIDNNCLGIKPSSEVNFEWAYQLLLSFDFSKYQAGTSVPAISQGTIGEIIVGLPPVLEQNRIVTKIEQLLKLCDVLEAQFNCGIEKQSELLNSVMAQM